ncbi:MAG: homoserine O-acetyltransferase [Thiohalorhabdus sp.]|uniref:homoserine O-succinyltransferase MetX n=1 Tax=Thiohalorhabdus sp. TaxID=3094134 RepID=UPI00398090F2
MPETIPEDSVGLVEGAVEHFDEPLELESGERLERFDLAYETYGTLNADHSNAVLVCHALSGDQHAAGYQSMEDRKPGWWDNMIGPGKPLDTRRFFVVCVNVLGSCKGSTGPASINPATGEPYALDFPIVTVKDWVASQRRLMERLSIAKWVAVVGGSLGGMQALQWTIDYPERLDACLAIAAAPKLSAQNIAFNEVARQAIMTDPEFHGGRYYERDTPRRGLALARMIGHITYLSEDAMRDKFGRDLRKGQPLSYGFDVDFEVESYLRYQGRRFVDRFDANSYLYLTKVLDYFDPAGAHDGDLAKAFAGSDNRFLVIAFSSDWRFSADRSREITHALYANNLDVTFAEIEAPQGHDAFLLRIGPYHDMVRAYMDRLAREWGL